MIEDYADDALKNLVDYRFTDHSIDHSFRILKIIDRILEQSRKINFLTDIEKYVLRAAALLHDIGMQEEAREPDSGIRREKHPSLSIERIQSDHESIGILGDLVDPICDVISAHRGNFTNYADLPVRTGQRIRMDLLEALLFIGDELDISHERVNVNNIKKLKFDINNYIHFFKHLYTSAIDISDRRGITILFQCPKGRENNYKIILEHYVIRKIEKSLTHANHILNDKYGIDIYLDKENGIIYKESSSLSPIDPNIYERIINQLFLPKSLTSLDSLNFDEMQGNHNSQQFFNGYTTWEEIVNGLDIQRTQSNDVYELLQRNMEACCENRNVRYCLITGGGGAGKTTFMMRLAYRLFNEHGSHFNILWYDGSDYFEAQRLPNLYHANQKPIYIFIDSPDINTFVNNISDVQNMISDFNIPLLFMIAARLSEWQNATAKTGFLECDHDDIPLANLDDQEIIHLLNKLEIYDELGVLKELNNDERFARLKEKHERQLLVAMLEATRGDNFENIILDEHNRLKASNPVAARAYELVALFHKFFVSTPKSILMRYLSCDDEDELNDNILNYTRLIIVKDMAQRYGDYYKARHREIADVLIKNLDDYNTETKRLKRVGAVINQIDLAARPERYYIMNFLRNYIENIIRAYPKAEYEDRIYELRNKIIDKRDTFLRMLNAAAEGRFIPEISILNYIFFKTSLADLQIQTLNKWLELEPRNAKANEFLAKTLNRTKRASPEVVASYYYKSYTSGNRRAIFLLEFVHYCIRHHIYDYIEKVIDSINDFLTYNEDVNEALRKLEILLKGYKVNRDRDILAKDASIFFHHLQASKLLKPKEELFYIDSHESSNPREACAGYERHLLTIAPARPKSILMRLAYLTSRLPDKRKEAIKYYEELFDSYLKDTENEEDYILIKKYLTFALQTQIYNRQKYYMLFNRARRLNSKDIDLYLIFSQYLSMSDDPADLNNCKSIAKDGIAVAKELNKMYIRETKRLKEILITLKNKGI